MIASKKKMSYVNNLTLAKRLWAGQINREQKHLLRSLSENYGLSIAAGDMKLLQNRWYVTHCGLIRLARRRGCSGITVHLVTDVSDWASSRWVFKAIVYKNRGAKKFVGYGDVSLPMCLQLFTVPSCASLRLELSTEHYARLMESEFVPLKS
jgi:hypothetical protein